MRFLSANAMLCLLPAARNDEQAALARASVILGEKERLPELTERGELRTASIHHEGKPVAVIWYRVERERLVVDTLIGIGKGRNTEEAFQTIFAGVENVAHSYGCNSVEGVTSRAALAKVYLDHGFEARGVLMRKTISPREAN